MRTTIAAFIDQQIPDISALDGALRALLAEESPEAAAGLIRQGIIQANLRRESPRRAVAMGALYRLMAELAVSRGDLSGACSHYAFAARELCPVLNPGQRAQLHLDVAWVYHCLGDYKTSLEFCAQAQRALESQPESPQEALAHSMRGINFYRMGQLDDALWEHSEALSRRSAHGDQAGVAASLNNLGNVHMDRGDWNEGARCYQLSLERYHALGLTDREASLENNLGNLAAYQGDFGAAEHRHASALALRSQLGDRFGSGASRCALANAWLRAGRIDDAIEGFRRGLRLLDVSGAVELRAEGMIGLAHALLVKGAQDEARRTLELGLEEARRTHNRLQLGAGWVLYAKLERLEGRIDAATEALAQAFEQLGSVGSRYEFARVQLEAAHVHWVARRRERAREALAFALKDFEALGARPELVEAEALEARIGSRTLSEDSSGGLR